MIEFLSDDEDMKAVIGFYYIHTIIIDTISIKQASFGKL